MNKIEDLSAEQEARLELYYERWLKIGIRFGPTTEENKAAAERAIIAVYTNNDLKIPEMLWAQSPDAAVKELIRRGDTDLKTGPMNAAGFGQHDASWLGFYEFFRKEVGLVEETEDLVPLMELAEHCGWWWPYENYCMLSEIPTFLSLDAEGNLHNTERSAIQYSDDFEIYCMHGVEMPEWVIQTPAEKLSSKKILAITNVEQRLLAIKKLGAHNMLKELNGKCISKKNPDKNKDSHEYELFELDLLGSKEKLLKMKNPSEPKEHYEFVEPGIKTVDEALAWRIGWDLKRFREPVAKT